MARIKDESVRAVVAAADMVEVVSGRTTLRKAGARFTGRCPFHEERTPSFSVNATDKLYYCFGCGAKGDVITFVRETENLDFAGAVETLAERFRVQLEYEETSPQADAQRKKRERLYALLEQAASFYERYLWDSAAGEPVRAYLAGRSLGEEVSKEFRLGLAPLTPMLSKKALEKGFTTAELREAGLLSQRGGDYFSGRLLFPLADARGRVLGFQARKMREDDPLRGKYVNSPEGELFRKGSLLYGLHLARNAIAKQDRALVVEGNADVLALRQAGLEPVVASMGTALTERQLKELSRLTHKLYLCFDGDAAGQEATLRGMELAVTQGFDVKVVALPPGVDPADDPTGFEPRLARAESYVLHRVRIEIERAADKQEGFVRVREFLTRMEDSPDVQDAVRLAADRLDLPADTQAGLMPRGRAKTGTVTRKVLEAGERLERMFLAACVLDPVQTKTYLEQLGDQHFEKPEHRRLRAALAGAPEGDGESELRAELWATADLEGITADSAKGLFLALEGRFIERQIYELRRNEMTRADEERHAELVRLQSKIQDAVAQLS